MSPGHSYNTGQLFLNVQSVCGLPNNQEDWFDKFWCKCSYQLDSLQDLDILCTVGSVHTTHLIPFNLYYEWGTDKCIAKPINGIDNTSERLNRSVPNAQNSYNGFCKSIYSSNKYWKMYLFANASIETISEMISLNMAIIWFASLLAICWLIRAK